MWTSLHLSTAMGSRPAARAGEAVLLLATDSSRAYERRASIEERRASLHKELGQEHAAGGFAGLLAGGGQAASARDSDGAADASGGAASARHKIGEVRGVNGTNRGSGMKLRPSPSLRCAA